MAAAPWNKFKLLIVTADGEKGADFYGNVSEHNSSSSQIVCRS